MDIYFKIRVLFVIILQLLLCNILRGEMMSSRSYSLARSCKTVTFDDDYSRKLKLNINLTGALIRSHDDYLSDSFYNGIYPENLSCEVVAEAPVGSKIMLLIESLNIPTDTSLCDENYLYVFDYDSSRSKAMATAGGEKGLCGRAFPRFPIITTGPYITIVFNSKIKSSKVTNDAGFLLTLTEIISIDKNSQCGADRYQCGSISQISTTFQRDKRTINKELLWSPLRSITSKVTLARHIIPKVDKSSIITYCIPLSLVCDQVKNCHDGSDEDTKTKKFCSDLQSVGIINKFLSLGLSASIAIAVSCIIAITLCVGLTACYCVRLCTSGSRERPVQLSKDIQQGSQYQGMMITPPIQGVNMDGYYASNFVIQPSNFMAGKDNSSASSFETDKMYYMYRDPQKIGYLNMGRPASEKICHWGTCSLVSYPSNSDGHHSHPETPYLMRDPSKNDWSPRHMEHVYRPPLNNTRCHHNTYNHQTPTSSRSAKSTRSTKSSNVDKKNAQTNESKSANNIHNNNNNNNNDRENNRQYPLNFGDEAKIRIMGPILGQV